jgi:hypothetical protein
MQLRHARRERQRVDRAARLDRAASIIGPILGVLDDMEPASIVEHGGRSPQTVENIGRRWWRARDALLIFSAASPSEVIATKSQELAEAVARSWASMTGLNRALQALDSPARHVDQALLDRARDDHEQATKLAHELEALSRDARRGAPVS